MFRSTCNDPSRYNNMVQSETGGVFEYTKFSVIAYAKLRLLMYSNWSALFISSENTYKFDKITSPDTNVERAAPAGP